MFGKKEKLNFTSHELEKLLGKAKLSSKQNFILVYDNNKKVHHFNSVGFEDFFGIPYLPHIRFKDESQLKKVVHNCPWILKYTSLGKENTELGKLYSKLIWNGNHAQVVISWDDDLQGYGLYAMQNIPPESFIGIYTGFIRQINRWSPELNAYCFHYPTRFCSWNYFLVDALNGGNEMRFINHSDNPNVYPRCLEERGLLYFAFFSKEYIEAGTELTFDYGKDYWLHRKKKRA